MNEELLGDCTGKQCGFGFDPWTGEIGCTDGASCYTASLLEAEETKFHDIRLVEATNKINEILNSLREPASAKKLSLLKTSQGFLLAWTDHAIPLRKDSVTENSDDATIASALKLKGVVIEEIGIAANAR